MIRTLLWILTGILLICGLALLVSSVVPLIRDFADLKTTPGDLTPPVLRLLAALALIGSSRWTVQAALKR